MIPVPSHMADQVQAAVKDRDKAVADAGLTGQRAMTPTLTELIDRCIGAWVDGGNEMCVHLPGRGPTPVWMLLSEPTVVMCGPCFDEANTEIRDTDEDLTCDLCRKVCPEGVYNIALPHSFLALVGGICEECRLLVEGGV